MKNIIVANIFSFIGSALVVISIFAKQRKDAKFCHGRPGNLEKVKV